MKKRSYLVIFLMMISLLLISCKKTKIDINLSNNSSEILVGEQHEITFETNDKKGVSFSSNDEKIATVDEKGVITGIDIGETLIKLTSKTDKKVSVEFKVKVNEQVSEITIKVNETKVDLNLGETFNLDVETNDEKGVTFESDNNLVATVDQNGLIKAIENGKANITIISKTNNDVKKIVSVTVLKEEKVDIKLPKTMLLNSTILASDIHSEEILVTHFDENILSFEEGELKAVGVGSTTIKVELKDNINNYLEHEITVLDHIILSNDTRDELTYNDNTYVRSETMFNSLLALSNKYDLDLDVLVLEGKYIGDVTFEHSVNLIGTKDAVINGALTFKGENVSVEHLTFVNDSKIILDNVTNFTFINNKVSDITDDFIKSATDVLNVSILENEFKNISKTAINLSHIGSGGFVEINKNIINEAEIAIQIKAETKFARKNEINLYRNKIDQVNTAFSIDLNDVNSGGNYIAYGRFNEVTNYEVGIDALTNGLFEWTLNYWGEETINYSNFKNVPREMLLGTYENPNEIISEKDYKPTTPVYFEILNPINEIYLGEDHKIDYITLPYSASNALRWITSETNIVRIQSNGFITPLKSGEIIITVFPSTNRSIQIEMDLIVMTDPGIHVTPSVKTHGLLVGDNFELDAKPFPYNLAENSVNFTTSDNTIATIDNQGNVEVVGVGKFELEVRLDGYSGVVETLYFESYDDLDDSNIMDFIIKRQMQFSERHEFVVYGAGYNYDAVHHESVARFLFGDVIITNQNQTTGEISYVPISPGVRPGTKKNSNINSEYKFNDENVTWIVVHETANTGTGSGALSHHNYLLNRTSMGALDYTSWHMTMDSENLYQHIPLDEIAWHAGDGSTLPGAGGTYLGGGNRNGIGIEMSVNDDGNILKTWQRTAKHAASLLDQFNMPFSQLKYHQSFSGKTCPQSMIRGGFIELFEEMAENELKLIQNFSNIKSIELVTEDSDYIDPTGVIIKNPEKSITLNYEVVVTFTDNSVISKSFPVYLPGSWM